ncbi:hypothetical protein [Streptomyces sp. NPDC059909]|uniref:hypothetical protein n=1 Tax=Streptomyces sp. NPDC059909 TaxID=3346998 RepID=UPI00365FA1BF
MPASPAARASVPTPTQVDGRHGSPHPEQRQERRPDPHLPHTPPECTPGPGAGVRADSADDVVRWGAFSCLLVPVVLVAYGTSVGGAAAAALGLAAVTAVCRVLLRRSERAAALPVRARAHRGGGRRGRNAPRA